jgi:hypothetical protein
MNDLPDWPLVLSSSDERLHGRGLAAGRISRELPSVAAAPPVGKPRLSVMGQERRAAVPVGTSDPSCPQQVSSPRSVIRRLDLTAVDTTPPDVRAARAARAAGRCVRGRGHHEAASFSGVTGRPLPGTCDELMCPYAHRAPRRIGSRKWRGSVGRDRVPQEARHVSRGGTSRPPMRLGALTGNGGSADRQHRRPVKPEAGPSPSRAVVLTEPESCSTDRSCGGSSHRPSRRG